MLMLISAADLIALYLGLELMSLALYVVAAIRPRQRARRPKPGLKYFVLGALSSGMLLYGASLIYGFTGTVSFAGIAKAAADGAASVCLRAGVPVRRLLLQGLRGAVPHVDARRLRGRADAGHRFLCRRARRSPASPCSCARPSWPFPASRMQWQQIVVFVVDRLDGARRVRRDRPAQHQAADGLFVDRPYGLCAGRPGRRHAGRRAGRARLHGDLCGDDARHLRLHPVDAPRRATGGGYRRSRRAGAHQSGAWRSSSRCCCSRSPAFRRSPASSPSSMCSSPPSRPGCYTLAVIGVLASVVGAYYYLPIVKIMYFDEPARKLSSRCRRTVAPGARRVRARSISCSSSIRRRWSSAATAAAKSLF